MLFLALVFLLLAILSGIFGFTGIAGASILIAQVLFVVFLVGCFFSVLVHVWSNLPDDQSSSMLYAAVVFLIVALFAGLLGLGGIAGAASGIAEILFVIFLVMFLITLVTHTHHRS